MIRRLAFIFILVHLAVAQKKKGDGVLENNKKWQTINGKEPLVIARGGFTGLFPESSYFAVDMINAVSLEGTVNFCNLQLTKDGTGICLSSLNLKNLTTVDMAFPNDTKTYNLDGREVKGWFTIDYSFDELSTTVALIQNVFSRTNVFDQLLNISSVDFVVQTRPGPFWLNVEHATFYAENKLDVTKFVLDSLKQFPIDYLSSTEIGFLKNIRGKLRRSKTKLIFTLRDEKVVEPTTNKTYGEIVKDLKSIKEFAAGILVPKQYIWPVDEQNYLQLATDLVPEAHKLGLEVHASGFANDFEYSYNYSFDPVAEYLQFMDNSKFSVDGFLTDFPPTASEAIACFAHNKNKRRPVKGDTVIISHNGASGVYPGCTDAAYQQAIDDGVDVIDCNVQMTKDGVPICMSAPDLVPYSNAMENFMTESSSVPEIQKDQGIFTFDLSWSDIQTLTPEIENPFSGDGMKRNPANKNKGKFVTLEDFLKLAKDKKVPGVLVSLKNAPYLASKKGLGIVDSVKEALNKATLDQKTVIYIQSDDTSVLSAFRDIETYKRVLYIEEKISDTTKEALDEVKKHADIVDLRRTSLLPTSNFFLENATKVLQQLHKANISVHVSPFRNEFTSLAVDYFSDPTLEVATFAKLGVDGIVTDFPATVSRYIKSPCSDVTKENDLRYSIYPAEGGSLLSLVPPPALPPKPVEGPAGPPLSAQDVTDPPLPQVSPRADDSEASASADSASASSPPAPKASSAFANSAILGPSILATLLLSLLCFGN